MARKAKRDLTIEQQLARGPIDLPFLALVMLLTAIGLIMVLSASYASAMYNLTPNVTNTGGDPLYYFKRQFGFALLGLGAMVVISKIDYQHFRWMSVFALGASIVLMLLVFVPSAGSTFSASGFSPRRSPRWASSCSFPPACPSGAASLARRKSGASAPSRAGWRRGWTASACWS